MSGNHYRERLWTAATTTRDLMVHSGVTRWEIFAKASTVRETSADGSGRLQTVRSEETGVAVRAQRDGCSGFGAASGLEADASRRAADGAIAAELPAGVEVLPHYRYLGITDPPPPCTPPAPTWAAEVAEQLTRAVPQSSGGRLVLRRVVVQEGSYSWVLTTGDGFVAAYANSTASLVADIAISGEASGVWREWLHIPDPMGLDIASAASQICGRGVLATSEPALNTGSWDTILHSEVTAYLLAALAPHFLAKPREPDTLPLLLDREGQLTSRLLTIVDDRAEAGLPIIGPCDGEGLPARRTLLVEDGVPRYRLASFGDAVLCGETPRGGALRLSYRDYPRTGIANLKVMSDGACSPAQLLEMAPRAVYLLRPLTPVVLEPATDSYRILASGVWLDRGRVNGWQPVVELRGGIGQLLRRIDGVGSDPRWYQTSCGFVGAPSILIRRQPVVG